MAHLDDATLIEKTHNTARYFTEQKQVAWVALIGTVLWGIFGYFSMPQRKDPDIPVITAMVITPWPGMDAERVEDRVTRRIEETVAENSAVDVIRSTTRTGVSYVYVDLKEGTPETGKVFDDIALKLNAIEDLPEGAGPIQFMQGLRQHGGAHADGGEPADGRGPGVAPGRPGARGDRADPGGYQGCSGSPWSTPSPRPLRSRRSAGRPGSIWRRRSHDGVFRDARLLEGAQFIGVDGAQPIEMTPPSSLTCSASSLERLRVSEFHPDALAGRGHPGSGGDPRQAAGGGG